MTVYVDQLRSTMPSRRWPHSCSCHMFADADAELHGMAAAAGLPRYWFQKHRYPHYDLTAAKRNLVIDLGARTVATRDWIRRQRATELDTKATNG